MSTLWQLWMEIIKVIPMMLTDTRYLLIIALVMMMVHSQYKRKHAMEQRMFGLIRGTPWQDTLTAVGYGLMGGIIATVFFFLLGISLSELGIVYLWVTALLLMVIHPRFLCFSYAGGLISLSSLVFGFPQVDVAAIMSLVAVLHLVEALLIFWHGHQKATPVYVKHSSGKIVGGFSMQKFWPLPFVALVAVVMLESGVDFGTIPMPDWWPLLKPDTPVPSGHTMVYVLFPVLAALGYSDVAITSRPQEKTRRSALYLWAFSIVLLVLALLADRIGIFAYLAALFSPLGHEWVIYSGQQQEKTKPPVFTSNVGVMVLDVYPNSPAEKMGLQSGDVILRVNGAEISSLRELTEEMTPWAIDPVFTVINPVVKSKQRDIHFRGKVPPIGIIPIPDPHQGLYMEMREGAIKTWLRRLLNKRKG